MWCKHSHSQHMHTCWLRHIRIHTHRHKGRATNNEGMNNQQAEEKKRKRNRAVERGRSNKQRQDPESRYIHRTIRKATHARPGALQTKTSFWGSLIEPLRWVVRRQMRLTRGTGRSPPLPAVAEEGGFAVLTTDVRTLQGESQG